MKNMFLIYKIYYSSPNGNFPAYLGRTKQPINARLRGHFYNKPLHKKIDIFQVSKIEIAECKTEADMFLYEIYYINVFKPMLNKDDKAHDTLTLVLPELDFKEYNCKLLDKWKENIQGRKDAEKLLEKSDGFLCFW